MFCEFYGVVICVIGETDFCFVFESQIFNFAIQIEAFKDNPKPIEYDLFVFVDLTLTIYRTLFRRLTVGFCQTSYHLFLFSSQSKQFSISMVDFIITINKVDCFLSWAFQRFHVLLNEFFKFFFCTSSHWVHLSFCNNNSMGKGFCQPLPLSFFKSLWSKQPPSQPLSIREHYHASF